MTKDLGVQFSFGSGELSKKMWGRFDLPQYKSGCERVENFIVHPQGNVSFREGFIFSGETKDNKVAYCHSYHYRNNYYVLEFTDGFVRAHNKDGVVTTREETITTVNRSGNNVTFRISGADYTAGESILFTGIPDCPELDNRMMKIDTVVSGVHSGTLEGTFATATSSDSEGTVRLILEHEVPFKEKDLFELQFAQTAVTLYIAHNLYNPIHLRVSISVFTGFYRFDISDFTPSAGLTFSEEHYPATVTFFESRLFFGGSISEPQAIWGSKAGSISNFTVGSNVGDGVKYTLSSTDASVIKFLSSTSKLLVIGTSGGIFGATTATSTTSFEVRPVDGFPVEAINPIQKNNNIISVQAGARRVRSLNYSFQADGYVSNDLNVASEDITEGNIKQIAYIEGSPEVIWCVKNTGELIGLTYKPEVDVFAWHRHQLAEGDKILSVGSLTRDLNYEQLWVVIEREIAGRTVRSMEYMQDSFDYPVIEDFYTGKDNMSSDKDIYRHVLLERQKSYIHVDGAYTYDGSVNSSPSTLILSDTTGDITIRESSSGFYALVDVGMQIWQKNTDGTKRGRGLVTGKEFGSTLNVTVLVDFSEDRIAPGEYYITTDKINNLNHLEGREVRVIADGAAHPDATVVGGSIDLKYQASVVHVGLGYTGLVKTTNLNSIQYFSQTKPKNAYKFALKLLDTAGISAGTDIYRAQQIFFRNTSSLIDNPPELFSGDKIISYSDNWRGDKNIVILQEESLPCTILMVIAYLEVGER